MSEAATRLRVIAPMANCIDARMPAAFDHDVADSDARAGKAVRLILAGCEAMPNGRCEVAVR